MPPIAHDIERSSSDDVRLSEFLTLQIDRNALRASTLARLDSAVEVIGTGDAAARHAGSGRTDAKTCDTWVEKRAGAQGWAPAPCSAIKSP
jgi:hypothetical protein